MKKIIGISIIIVAAVVIYQFFLKDDGPEFDLAEVVKGDVVQEVSETGQIKKGDKLELSFKSSGVIEKIYIEVGEKVKQGDILARLENEQLMIQLVEAQANLELYEAQLDKLLAGATPEEVQVKQTAVDNAQTSLRVAEQALADVRAQGEDNLEATYGDALNVLDDSYIKIFNAKNTVDLVRITYFTTLDQEGVLVSESEDKIENALNRVESYLNTAKGTEEGEDIDDALSEMKKALDDTAHSLKVVRETCDVINYKSIVSSTSKSSLDTHRGYINTALTNIVNSQQTISSTKLTNTTNINTYQGNVDTARGTLRAAEDNLINLTAAARKEDVELYQAQVKQAEAKVQLLEKQLKDSTLKSPIDGEIISIEKKEGEMVQAALKDVVMGLFPVASFEIEVDIYEEDVVKIDIEDEVDISLVAFSDQILKGRVISIDPAEKIIDGVVYYEVSITFDESVAGIKSGMTADLVIRTDFRKDVLVIPEDALKEVDGQVVVEVREGEVVTERSIEVGLRGSDDLVEVLSGISEGEEVILR